MINSNEIIQAIKQVNSSAEIEAETDLLKDGILDSLSIMKLIMQLNEMYKIEISFLDIIPENFVTAEAIAQLVNSKIA